MYTIKENIEYRVHTVQKETPMFFLICTILSGIFTGASVAAILSGRMTFLTLPIPSSAVFAGLAVIFLLLAIQAAIDDKK